MLGGGIVFQELSVEIATYTGSDDDEDGVDPDLPDEQSRNDGYPTGGEGDVGTLRHVERRNSNQGDHSRTNAAEHGGYPTHLHEMMEEHGDEQDDDERGQCRSEGRADGSTLAAQLVADERGDVDGEYTRTALGNGYEVDKLLTAHPLVLLHHFRFDNGNHGIAASQREGAYLEEGLKTVPV